jgi:ribosomal protein S18 acetylase RimI-like enzyme
MEIQRLRQRDREAVREILAATARFTSTEIGWADELVAQALSGNEDYEAWIANGEDDAVRGYVLFGPVPRTEDVYDLYWIAVDPRFQGQGVGQRLLRFVEAQVRARSGRMLLIETRSRAGWEPTHHFYRSAGYEETSRIKDFYRIEDDKVVFCKRLTD